MLLPNLKRYEIASPIATHTRPGTCEEAGCLAMRNGFRTELDETSTLGQMQAHYIRRESGRSYREHRDERGLTVFTFKPGQDCFTQHRVPADRPELYLIRDGLGRLERRHDTGANWMDDLHTHTDRLLTVRERG